MVNGNIKKPIDSLEFDFDDYSEYLIFFCEHLFIKLFSDEGTNKLSVDHKRYYDFITSVILNEKICENENDEDNEKLFVVSDVNEIIKYFLSEFSFN